MQNWLLLFLSLDFENLLMAYEHKIQIIAPASGEINCKGDECLSWI